jgi:hypothetical protein
MTLLEALNARDGAPSATNEPTSTALVAAKQIYFGVGGGVVPFVGLLSESNAKHKVLREDGKDSVSRVVLEVWKTASGRI